MGQLAAGMVHPATQAATSAWRCWALQIQNTGGPSLGAPFGMDSLGGHLKPKDRLPAERAA
jgi:hypothetical protein